MHKTTFLKGERSADPSNSGNKSVKAEAGETGEGNCALAGKAVSHEGVG